MWKWAVAAVLALGWSWSGAWAQTADQGNWQNGETCEKPCTNKHGIYTCGFKSSGSLRQCSKRCEQLCDQAFDKRTPEKCVPNCVSAIAEHHEARAPSSDPRSATGTVPAAGAPAAAGGAGQ